MHLSPTSKLGYLSFNSGNLGPQKTDSGVFIIVSIECAAGKVGAFISIPCLYDDAIVSSIYNMHFPKMSFIMIEWIYVHALLYK